MTRLTDTEVDLVRGFVRFEGVRDTDDWVRGSIVSGVERDLRVETYPCGTPDQKFVMPTISHLHR